MWTLIIINGMTFSASVNFTGPGERDQKRQREAKNAGTLQTKRGGMWECDIGNSGFAQANWPNISLHNSKAHPADASWRNLGGAVGTWDWDMAGHCGASRAKESALHCIEEDLVMKPRTGKQLLEHSGRMTRVTIWVIGLEDCKRFGK